MRIYPPRRDRGIALIIVMMVILVLAVLAGGFAYSIKVETRLARNTAWESDMEWLGRSGVERAKYCLAMHLAAPPPENAYAGLNQQWAGAPPNPTNEVLAAITLKDVQLGPGKFNVTIQDLERKFNLSAISESNPMILERALLLVGADSADIPTITDSYFDWVDADNKTHLAGAESPDYLRMDAPYYAKNGPVDDIRELLLIKGMTEQIFWGTTRVGAAVERDRNGKPLPTRRRLSPYLENMQNMQTSGVGLYDLFVPFHGAGRMVNINTASSEVLQVAGLDPGMADALIAARNGPDAQPGTEDDIPFLNMNDALGAIGADPGTAAAVGASFTTMSRVFEVTVDAEIGAHHRRFVALVDRRSRTDVTTLSFTWK
jgi:type II secretory pathway component PulK